jgi:hypothetical protein
MNFIKESTVKQKLIAFGIIALLSIGALGAMGTFSDNKQSGEIISSLAEKVGLKEKTVENTVDPNAQTATPKLSKEYIYAGSRTLATEDYFTATPTPTPPPITYTLAASPPSLTTGGIATVNWTASQARPATDYIGLFAVGAADNAPLSTQNIAGGTSGNMTATMNTIGSFNFRYFNQGNPTPVAISNTVNVTAPSSFTATLNPTPLTIQTGGVETVNWTASQARPATDYIGLFAVGAANNAPVSTQTITAGSSGARTFAMPTAGSFNFRYFAQGNPNPIVISSAVTVITVTLTAPSAAVTAPANVTTNWTSNSSRPATDSIKLYKGTALVVSKPIVAGTSGAILFTGIPKGTYTFQYFVQGNAMPIKTSSSFMVK